MAYGADIDALSPDHRWEFDGNEALDQVGSTNGTATGTASGSALCLDVSNCIETNTISGDRISIPTTTTINNSVQTRKAVGGWFEVSKINAHPCRVYGEGINTLCYHIVMAFGNNVMFEVVDASTIQTYGISLVPDRPYHLYTEYQDSAYGNAISFYIDGILQGSETVGDAGLTARGVGEFGDPAGTVGVGGDVILLQAPVVGRYNQWATWSNKILPTATEIREELFEKGVIADQTVSTGTESAMQTAINGLSDPENNVPCALQIQAVTGGGDLTLDFDTAMQFNPLASIHVQYTGADTLTLENALTTTGIDENKLSTPNGGSIILLETTYLDVYVKDAVSGSAISGARIIARAAAGGGLTEGTVLENDITDGTGNLYFGVSVSESQPIELTIRKGTSSTYYKTAIATTTAEYGTTSIEVTVLMVKDE